MLITAWLITHVYPDACRWLDSAEYAGTSRDELVAALAAQAGHSTTEPCEVGFA